MTGRRMAPGTKTTMLECQAGILICWILGMIILFFLPVDHLSTMLGYTVGCVMSAMSLWHIAYVTENIVAMHNSKAATRFTFIRYVARKVIVFVVVAASFYLTYLNMITLIIGLFGLKAGAYLQPLVHRFLDWCSGRR